MPQHPGSQPLKVLVTGADGFIAHQLLAALRAAGHGVLRGVRPASSSRGEREDTSAVELDVSLYSQQLLGLASHRQHVVDRHTSC